MRVLFAASLIAALVSAGGAPAPSGNSAKRNIDQHLAPHRYDNTKTLISLSDSTTNAGAGELTLQVVLKADDFNRQQQEFHTTLSLVVDGVEEGDEVNMGFAMNVATDAEIPFGSELDG